MKPNDADWWRRNATSAYRFNDFYAPHEIERIVDKIRFALDETMKLYG
jgi:hypothetical protein